MDKFRGLIIAFAFWFLVFSLGFVVFAAGDHQHTNDMHDEQPAKRILQDSYSLVTRTSKRYWERVKNLINQLQMNFLPPNLDFRSTSKAASNVGEEGHNTAGGTVKEAAGKSFHASKAAVEKSSKSAAKAVGEAVHKTTEKVKGTSASTDEDSHEEL